ncbi:MAG: tetratricopeptide repeat protein [Candidatus Omnitrophica bacterium]|nr:tetratricopeptide repeat protein [Candidatus Omnitrophota bacterium]
MDPIKNFRTLNFKRLLPPLLLLLAGFGAYHNSFTVPFMFDDSSVIFKYNSFVRQLDRGWAAFLARRSLVDFSFGLNYVFGGRDVVGYHGVNFIAHVLAAFLLYRIVDWTLQSAKLSRRYSKVAGGIALSVALIWVCHPIQTQSVTYLSQRAEILMGVFYLMTLLCFIRGTHSTHKNYWFAACILFCTLGQLAKEIMVTAPLAVLFYDYAFVSYSWKELWSRHWFLYLGLSFSWFLFLGTFFSDAVVSKSVGLSLPGISPWDYAWTEPRVILHYLGLCFWPKSLCLDYAWPIARDRIEILPFLIVFFIFIATLLLWRRQPALGFSGLCFFLILAPTSSFIPIADAAAEHRMYLPLATVTTLTVVGGYEILKCLFDRIQIWDRVRSFIFFLLVLGLVAGLSVQTIRRNSDYRKPEWIWGDVVKKQPNNPRGYYNLATVLREQGHLEEATANYVRALSIKPDYADAHNSLGWILQQKGNTETASFHYHKALESDPKHLEALNNLGTLALGQGDIQTAIGYFSKALKLYPNNFMAAHNLNVAREMQLNPGKMPFRFNYQESDHSRG